MYCSPCKPCDRCVTGKTRWQGTVLLPIEASVTKSVNGIIKSDLQLPGITEKDFDKCHRTGPIDDDGKQNIIMKFT